jgi:hypothetical protein
MWNLQVGNTPPLDCDNCNFEKQKCELPIWSPAPHSFGSVLVGVITVLDRVDLDDYFQEDWPHLDDSQRRVLVEYNKETIGNLMQKKCAISGWRDEDIPVGRSRRSRSAGPICSVSSRAYRTTVSTPFNAAEFVAAGRTYVVSFIFRSSDSQRNYKYGSANLQVWRGV